MRLINKQLLIAYLLMTHGHHYTLFRICGMPKIFTQSLVCRYFSIFVATAAVSKSCLNGTRSHLKIAKNDPISLGGIACVDAISDALIVNLPISWKILVVVLFSCRCAMQ